MKSMADKSFTQVPNYVIRNSKINPLAKIVYVVLKSFNPSFPSYKKIMEYTGIKSKTTISNSLRILINARFIEKKHDPRHKSNLYEFCEMDLDSPITGLELLHEVDTNNTNTIIPISNTNGSPAPPKGDVEPLEYSQKFNKLAESLGPSAKCGYIEKKRPTMIIKD